MGTSHTMASARPNDELTQCTPKNAVRQRPLHPESVPVGKHYLLGLHLSLSRSAKRTGFAMRGVLPDGTRLPREVAMQIATEVMRNAHRDARMCGHRFQVCQRCSGLRCTICHVSSVHHQFCRCPKPSRRSARIAERHA